MNIDPISPEARDALLQGQLSDAIISNDIAGAKEAIKNGADPWVSNRGASSQMTRLLNAAQVLPFLYAIDTNDDTGTTFDHELATAAQSLDIEKVEAILETRRNGKNDLNLWRDAASQKDEDILRAMLAFYPDVIRTLAKTYIANDSVISILHEHMETLSPKLQRFLESIPHFSRLRPTIINTNHQGDFDCRHIAWDWATSQIKSENQEPDYDEIVAPEKRVGRREQVDEEFRTFRNRAPECDLFEDDDHGDRFIEVFENMADGENVAWIIELTPNHALVFKLFTELNSGNTERYVYFFESNLTGQHSEVRVTDLRLLKNLRLTSFLYSEEKIETYLLDRDKQTLALRLPNDLQKIRDLPPLEGPRSLIREHETSALLTPSALFYLLTNGFDKTLQMLRPAIVAKPSAQLMESLSLQSDKGQTGIYMLSKPGFHAPLEVVCNILSETKLTSKDIHKLFMEPDIEGIPFPYLIYQHDQEKSFEALCEFLPNSQVEFTETYSILMAMTSKRTPGPYILYQMGHRKTFNKLCEFLPKSGLPLYMITNIILARNENGTLGSFIAVAQGHHEFFLDVCRNMNKLELRDENKQQVLVGKKGDGLPALLAAVAENLPTMVRKFKEGLSLSGLSEEKQHKVLKDIFSARHFSLRFQFLPGLLEALKADRKNEAVIQALHDILPITQEFDQYRQQLTPILEDFAKQRAQESPHEAPASTPPGPSSQVPSAPAPTNALPNDIKDLLKAAVSAAGGDVEMCAVATPTKDARIKRYFEGMPLLQTGATPAEQKCYFLDRQKKNIVIEATRAELGDRLWNFVATELKKDQRNHKKHLSVHLPEQEPEQHQKLTSSSEKKRRNPSF